MLEYCDSGTLATYLNKNEAAYRPPPWYKRIGLLMDVSEGMQYLHMVRYSLSLSLSVSEQNNTNKTLTGT